MGLKFESGLWVKTIFVLGSEYLMEQISTWSIQITTTQKFLQIHMKNKRHKRVLRLLQPDQRQKQNHKRGNLLMCQVSYRCTKENGLTLSHQNKILLRTISRRKWSVFFDTIKQYSGKTMEQFNSGKLNFIFEINSHKFSIGLMSVGKLVWQQEEVRKEDQYCSDNSGTILYLRALQGHSGSNLIDPMLQDNVLIGTGIFPYIYHIGCAFNLHSIINNGLIPGGQNSSKRQTVFFLPIDPRDKDHEDPEHIDFSVPRRARYLHSAWKKHQDAVFWVDIDLEIRKGLTFYQTRSNAIILQGTPPACCIPKVVSLKIGEVLYEKSYMSPRPPPKISLRHDHDWTKGNDELGSTVEQQRVMQAHDGTGQPVEQNSSSAHTVKEQFVPEENRDIPSFNTDNEFNRAINEENIDFNISGLPHSAVKRSHGVNVQNLIQKIENHPHRRTLQSDLQQHRPFNFFSKESRDVIKEAGNIELCELLDVQPKAQCKVCLSYWDVGIVYCTFGHFLRDDTKENKKYIKVVLDLFSIPSYYIKKGQPHGHGYGKKPGGSRVLHREFGQEKMQEETFLGYSRLVHPWWKIPKEHDWIGSNWRSMSWDGQIGERGSHTSRYCRRN